jgi:hypothetical protein
MAAVSKGQRVRVASGPFEGQEGIVRDLHMGHHNVEVELDVQFGHMPETTRFAEEALQDSSGRPDEREKLTTDEPTFRIGERLRWDGKNPDPGPVMLTGVKILGAARSIFGTTYLYEIRRLAFEGAAVPNGVPHWIPEGVARALLVRPAEYSARPEAGTNDDLPQAHYSCLERAEGGE